MQNTALRVACKIRCYCDQKKGGGSRDILDRLPSQNFNSEVDLYVYFCEKSDTIPEASEDPLDLPHNIVFDSFSHLKEWLRGVYQIPQLSN